MKTKFFRSLAGLFGALGFASLALGYSFLTNDSGQNIVWPAGQISMQIKLDNTVALIDGSTLATSVQTAMQAWSAQIVSVKFSPQIAAVGSGGDHNGVNEVFFSSSPYGYEWDQNTLAVTIDNFSGTRRSEADVIFNTAFTWDSFRGADVLNGRHDIQRVALHELGHVLGLDHPDEHGQSVTAIMNSVVSYIDALMPDDIAGAQLLYGTPPAPPTIGIQPSNQTVYEGDPSQGLVATAKGFPVPTIQWQKDGHDIPGATQVNYILDHAKLSDAGSYRMVATNPLGSATSDPAVLTVLPVIPLRITIQPRSQAVYLGTPTFVLSVEAESTRSQTFQWRKNGVAISGATGPVIIFNYVQDSDAADYSVLVTAGNESVLSGAATVTVFSAPGATAASSGSIHTLFLSTDGALWGLGSNVWGELGVPEEGRQPWIPTLIANGVRAIAAGGSHSLFIKNDDSLWATGFSLYGELGNGSQPQRQLVPIQVASNVAQASAGGNFSMHIKRDGTLWATGDNGSGQLGDGTTEGRNTWEQVADGVSWVSAGYKHVLFIKVDHSLWAVGDNQSGQLGDGTTHNRSIPVQIATGVRQAFAGGGDSYFIKDDDSLWAMGANSSGEVGNGKTTMRISPFLVSTGVKTAAAGGSHALFIKNDGTLWAMGDNTSGDLGVGTTVQSSVPLLVTGDVVAVSAGWGSSTFVKSDSSYWGMGDGTSGQIGFHQTLTNFPMLIIAAPTPAAPVFVAQPTNKVVAIGGMVTLAATASGVPGPAYHWRRNGVNLADGNGISGASTPDLTLANAQVAEAGNYTLVATNSLGSTVSRVAILSVGVSETAPAFVTQPANLTIAGGYSFIFSTQVTGIPAPTYQWQKNGVNISGATDSSYQVSLVAPNDAGNYRVVVTNSVGSVTSDEAVLTIGNGVQNSTEPTGDFDRDGQSDLIWQNTLTGERSFWLMNGTILKQGVGLGTFAPDWTMVATGDFNHDGQADLVWQNTITGERSIWLMNGTTLSLGVDLGTYPIDWMIVAAGDFNGDGQVDIVVQNTITGERSLWLMKGTTKTSEVSLGVVPPVWSIAGAGDLNGDGKLDLIWQNAATGERSVWLMNGTVMTSNVSLGIVAKQFQIVGTGDYNRDGKTDLVWTDTETGDRSIWLMNGLVRTAIVPLATINFDWSLGRPVFLTAQNARADFNADGQTDILWQNSSTGERSIWLMNGTTKTSEVSLGTVAANWVISGTGDFNHDEKPDLVWTNTATGERTVWLMDGTTMLSNVPLSTIPTNWVISAIGDFNYDGKPDFVWTNTTTGERSIWLMNGTVFGSGIALGTIPKAWAIATTADLNGDGKTDIIWQNKSTGECSVWLMNGGTFTAGVALDTLPVQWSIVGSGDFNGDGKADLLLENTFTGERVIRLMNRTTYLSTISLGTFDTHWSIKN